MSIADPGADSGLSRATPNFFSGGGIDRAGLRRKDTAWVAAQRKSPAARFLPVWRDRHLVHFADVPAPVFFDADTADALDDGTLPPVLLGLVRDAPVFAIDISAVDDPLAIGTVPAGTELTDIRDIGSLLDRADAQLMAHARGLVYWHRRHGFCGTCGAPTTPGEAGHVRLCSGRDCGVTHFPRTDPAVIMLVTDGARCLLGRRPGRQNFMYSTLAGFVEPGESLEEAVAREVLEETGVRIAAAHYAHSQPWPFPANLMLGFYAEAATTGITINPEELADARWFDRDEVRELMAVRDRADSERLGGRFHLPRPVSIARRLIADWIEDSVG